MAFLFLDGCDLHASHTDLLRRWTSASSSTQVDVLITGVASAAQSGFTTAPAKRPSPRT